MWGVSGVEVLGGFFLLRETQSVPRSVCRAFCSCLVVLRRGVFGLCVAVFHHPLLMNERVVFSVFDFDIYSFEKMGSQIRYCT